MRYAAAGKAALECAGAQHGRRVGQDGPGIRILHIGTVESDIGQHAVVESGEHLQFAPIFDGALQILQTPRQPVSENRKHAPKLPADGVAESCKCWHGNLHSFIAGRVARARYGPRVAAEATRFARPVCLATAICQTLLISETNVFNLKHHQL
jgi:hypothetical protein